MTDQTLTQLRPRNEIPAWGYNLRRLTSGDVLDFARVTASVSVAVTFSALLTEEGR